MKNLSFLTFILCFFAVANVQAQSACTPDQSFTEAGLFPDSDELDCIVRNEQTDIVIFFKNFDDVAGITVNWLRVDSITNLPEGSFYYTDQDDRQYDSGEAGCLRVRANTSDAAGQYQLGIWVTINAAGIGEVSGEAGALSAQFGGPDFSYWVRLKDDAGSACPSIDTTGASNLTTTEEGVFCTLNPGAAGCGFTSVNDINNVSEISIAPNPATSQAVVKFVAKEADSYTASLYNMVGKAVMTSNIDVVTGQNFVDLNLTNVPAGTYFYTLTNGKATATQKIVVTK